MKRFNRRAKWIIGSATISLLIIWPGTAWADDNDPAHTEQTRPIELGTTGGNINDISSAFCCSGTLGSLVEDADGQYILSNNHVLARTNKASLGDYIIQPGLIDQSPVCSQDTNDVVADLSDFIKMQFKKGRRVPLNEVDAAIARVIPGAVDGSILDIGFVSANTVPASIGQAVQKSGRTTGHTLGVVAAVDVTVDVGYSKECGGGINQVARFVNQIRINSGEFSAGGDSGSLVVEADALDTDGLPRAVGLLFAGSSSSTLANPIDRVLELLGVTMASGTGPEPGPTDSISGTVTNSFGGSAIGGATVSVDTGQSATTAAEGTYTITDVPTGDRSVTASATGFEDQIESATVNENQITIVDFALTEATEPTQAIVDCVIYDTEGGRRGDKNLLITISVVDDFGNPVSGAEVRIEVFRDGLFYGSGSGAITNEAGEVTYIASRARNGEYVTTVTEVVSSLVLEGSTPGNLFTKGTDTVPDADCRGDAPQPSGGAAHPGQQAQAAIDHARDVKARHEAGLFAINGVAGTGVGLSDTGEPVIEVYLGQENAAARAQLPAGLEGVAVRVLMTGPFVAF